MTVGRNDPCPCGSGKKYKKCCLNNASNTFDKSYEFIQHEAQKLLSRQIQLQKQQGLGRPIISIFHNGYRIVATGKRVLLSKKWQTFHDFLFDFIKDVLGKEWGSIESKKAEEDQHPIIQWFRKACNYRYEKSQKSKDELFSAPMTGAAYAILNLSYNLFLLEHNVGIQEKLIKRLKSKDLFQGALYETFVAAIFIKSGFTLEMEKEDDPNTNHCEFTAIAPITGNKYSIEAKARQPFKEHIGISKQLKNAFKKDALHKRIIFVDINIKNFLEKKNEIDSYLKEKENAQTDFWKDTQPAYIFITNHSFIYDLEGINFEQVVLAYGFKIDYFKDDIKYYKSLREAREVREKHIDMDKLLDSIKDHNTIPSTFDGEIPEFAFDKKLDEQRLVIGHKYWIPDDSGKKIVGILESATVSEHEKLAYGTYKLQDGKRAIYTCPISEEELKAYKKYPETFFGILTPQIKKVVNPLELYDFFYNSYKKTPREKLLELINNGQESQNLDSINDEELLKGYCEKLVYSAINNSSKNQANEI